MFKKILLPLLLTLFCLGNNVKAQITPDGILFQAVARDANGNAAAGRNIYAKVSILKEFVNGTSVYAESFKVVSTDDGIFTLVIGKGTRTSGVAGLTSISWNEALYFVNIKIAIEPSLPTPGWSPDAEYQDMGTSQLWSVPYALFATKSSVADSALSISTIVPGSKGGTGVNNNGKTITLAQNLNFKGVGDITITTTGASNISLPLTGLLANTQYVSDRFATDTISLSNRINALGVSTGNTSALKLNIADTSTMLDPYLRKADTANLSKRIDIKLDSAQIPGIIAPYLISVSGVKYADTAAMLLPYAIRSNTEASINAEKTRALNAEALKVNLADTTTMLSKYYNKTAADARLNLKTNNADTAAMLLPYAIRSNIEASINAEKTRALTAEALKVNIADTAIMLSKYFNKTAADARLNLKTNNADTAAMLLPYAIRSNTEASINAEKTRALAAEALKVNISDTAIMLSKYYNKTAADARLNLKTNNADTAAMLLPYAIRSNTEASINAEKARAIAEEALMIKIEDTAAMLLPYAIRSNTENSINTRVKIADTAVMLSNYYNKTAADARLNLKTNYSDTSAMLLPYAIRSNTESSINAEKTRALAAELVLTNNVASNTTSITANTSAISLRAPLASPTFTGVPTAPTAAAGTSTTQIATTAFVSSLVVGAATPDATQSIKGKIKLTNDLGGTADLPTVNTVGGVSSSTISTLPSLVTTNTTNIAANTLSITSNTSSIIANTASIDAEVIRAQSAESALDTRVNNNASQISTNTNNISINATNIQSNTTAINERVKYSDTTSIVAPYLRKSDTLFLSNRINLKAPVASPEFTGTVTIPSPFKIGATSVSTTGAQFNYLSSATGTTGTGNIVFSNSPVLVTPNLGTPISGIATNLTGLPLTTGVTGILGIANGGTGSSTKNFVDLNSDQDIGGIKTFSSNLIAGGTFNLTGSATLSNDLSVSGVTTLSSNASIAGTLSVTGVTSFSAQPIVSSLSANKPVFTDANKGLTSVGTLGIDQGGTGASNAMAAKTNLGLNLVNNTADLDKPISTLTQSALDLKENLANKSTSITTDATSDTKYPSVKSVKEYVDGTVSTATPDATTLVKGKVQLAGDLSGTAALPTIATVGGSTAADINSATIIANNATSINSTSTVVKRDANGDFSANTITANLLGTATNVTGVVLGANGGTGIANTGKTITLGGNINTGAAFTTSGTSGTSHPITLKTNASTSLILPSSGTLSTLNGTESLENKTINGLIPSSLATGFKIVGGTISKTFTLTDDATISGSNSGDQTITLTGDVTGTGTSSFATTLANSGVTIGTYGSATEVPAFTVDAKGRITNVSNVTISGVSSIGSALDAGKIIVGDANSLAAKVNMSGDVTINNLGTTSIGANKITTSKILNSNVTFDKIQNISASDKILGRISSGAGVIEEIATTGTGNVVRAISPSFTGTPLVPTAAVSSNDGTIANTQFVTRAIGNISASSVSGILPGANGGTGVNNTGKTITLGGNLVTSGTNNITLTTTGATNITLPTSGTLATLSDITGSTIGDNQITGVIKPNNGGTGIANNNANTISLGGSIVTGAAFTTKGTALDNSNASAIIFKTSAASEVTLPTMGTLSTLAGTETLSNKTIAANANTITGLTNANFSGAAGITDANLATIQTAGKIANSATTATEQNLANQIVARDASGNFSAGTITAALTGNASSATKLATPRTIYGNSFDGSANLSQVIASTFGGTGNGFTKFVGATSTEKVYTLPDANTTILTTNALVTPAQGGTGIATANANLVFAGPVSGAAAAPSFRALTAADVPAGSGSYIANSTSQQINSNFNISGDGIIGGNLIANLIKTPTGSSSEFLKANGSIDNNSYALSGANNDITSLTGLTTALSSNYGGTGINNAGKTITLGGDFATTGNKITLVSTSEATNVTLPISGTLATLTGTEALTNKTINGVKPTALATGFKIEGGTSSKTLTVSNTSDISGTNTGDISLTGEDYLTISGQTVTANAVNLSGTNVTGTLSAARFPALTGDITNTAGALATTISANAVSTSKIADANVTFAKIQNIASKKLIGNKSATSGVLGEIEIGSGLNLDETTGVLTAVSSGISSLNGLSATTQTFTTGTAAGTGNAFNIVSSGSTHTFNLPDASATVKGVVNTGSQTFAGTKTLDAVNVKGTLSGSTSAATISGFNAAINSVTSALTINGTNAADYNGKVLVCATGPTITFDGSSLPIGFTCMVLQSDNTVVQFVGTVNRYNYAATSGIYSIATVMCYASGSVLLTGDVQ
ncbi:MAG: hypothetical protein ACKOWO_03840 [Sediminibacterium sp.]